MSEVEEEIIKTEIKEYVLGGGGKYSEWCVGIASDVRKRLFGDYRVSEKSDGWIYHMASSIDIARKIELYFIYLGAKTNPAVVNEDTRIYLYKMS
jgi:hypothetical protein